MRCYQIMLFLCVSLYQSGVISGAEYKGACERPDIKVLIRIRKGQGEKTKSVFGGCFISHVVTKSVKEHTSEHFVHLTGILLEVLSLVILYVMALTFPPLV